MAGKILNSFQNSSGCTYDLVQKENGSYRVYCWNTDGELHWEVDGVVTKDDGVRQHRTPFTEETARAEFEKWRSL